MFAAFVELLLAGALIYWMWVTIRRVIERAGEKGRAKQFAREIEDWLRKKGDGDADSRT